ncbi:hypothetical protein CK203_095362 [Vitis vinifera]|uniref:Uncharacterized protein n=1 Tax=Vitis vinifera TaxID=29760 RepID=A0A438BTL0_VITVI|nr:hypothetical protein CK203_095362 [Vitis vinifera]
MDNLQSWVEQELSKHGVPRPSHGHGDSRVLGGFIEGENFSKPKHNPRVIMLKVGETRDQRGHTWCGLPQEESPNAMIEEKKKESDAKALVNGRPPRPWWTLVPLITLSQRMRQRCLELQASKERGCIKGNQFSCKAITRSSSRGGLCTSTHGKEGSTSTVAPMDEFKMVLGMDFLQKVKVVPIPFVLSMAILEEEKPCMVPTATKGTPKTPMLSTMQVKKGLKRKEVTYLATLKEERDNGSGEPMPKEIEGVLDEFKDVMPPELPKKLPLRERNTTRLS